MATFTITVEQEFSKLTAELVKAIKEFDEARDHYNKSFEKWELAQAQLTAVQNKLSEGLTALMDRVEDYN